VDGVGGQRSGVDAERRRLLDRLHDVQEEERSRIAVGLHDGPVQGLATLGFKLARARALLAEGKAGPAMAVLGECEADVAGEVAALRRIMHDLRPLVLDQQGLAAALEDQAEAVRARAGLAAGEVVLSVADDGAGFDPASLGGGGLGYGLTAMAERVEALGGRLAVRTAPGAGTMVEARVPGPAGPSAGRRS
jgi:signal transduction histidine kinase